MRNYSEEFFSNLKLLDSFLAPFHQGILRPRSSTGFKWFLKQWPVLYSCLWILIYTYLVLVERSGPEIVSQQMLGLMCIAQLAVKQINAKWQVDLLQQLLKWCGAIYSTKLKPEYQAVVDSVFERTNSNITTCIRWLGLVLEIPLSLFRISALVYRINCVLLGSAAASYLLQPLLKGNRETPTIISIDGVVYWPMRIFVIIYVGQVLYGLCVFFLLSGYDAIFMQCTMTMSYRFRTMSQLLLLLNYPGSRDSAKDTEIIRLIYKMHLGVLE